MVVGSALASSGVVDLASPAVGPLVRLSADSPFAHQCAPGAVAGYEVEPTATFDAPLQRVVAAWQANRARQGADGIVAASSSDGGLTWTAHAVPELSRCAGGLATAASDPWLTAGPDGAVYLSALELRRPVGSELVASSVVVTTSSDGGMSWRSPVTVAPDRGKNADKPTITADPLRAGAAYITWNQSERGRREVVLSHTTDGGLSWSVPLVVVRPSRGHVDLFPEVEVQPDGSLVIVYTDRARRNLYQFSHYARLSRDGGSTWSPPVRVDRLRSFFFPISLAPFAIVRADPDVFALAGGPAGAYLVSVLINPHRPQALRLPAVSEIVVSHQLPNGIWTPQTTIARVHGMAFLPTVATAGPQQVAVTWYQMPGPTGKRHLPRSHAPDTVTTIVSATSSDAGYSWRQQPLGPPFNLNNVKRGRQLFVGDYQALTATNRGYVAIDVRTPTRSGVDGSDVFAQAFSGG
jgi:hypothetical protein